MKQGKANRVLPKERTGQSKHPLPTTQEKRLSHVSKSLFGTLLNYQVLSEFGRKNSDKMQH